MNFSAWAPSARAVALVVGDQRVAYAVGHAAAQSGRRRDAVVALRAHAELFEWYRRLSELRRCKKSCLLGATRAARAVVKFDARDNWLKLSHGGLLTVFNFGGLPRKIPLPAGNWQLLLTSDRIEPDGKIAALGTAIYKRDVQRRG